MFTQAENTKKKQKEVNLSLSTIKLMIAIQRDNKLLGQ